jgi:hypothetical protein
MRMDRQIDMTELIVAFRNFASASKIGLTCSEMEILNTVSVTGTFYFLASSYCNRVINTDIVLGAFPALRIANQCSSLRPLVYVH